MEKGFLGYLVGMLQASNFRESSEDIRIAKGKYQLPNTWKGLKAKLTREWQPRRSSK